MGGVVHRIGGDHNNILFKSVLNNFLDLSEIIVR